MVYRFYCMALFHSQMRRHMIRYFIEKNTHTHINFIYNRLFCCNHTCYCVNMVSVTSASRYITPGSRYPPLYQSRPSMYIRGLIPWNFAELAEVVPIATFGVNLHLFGVQICLKCRTWFNDDIHALPQ